MKKKILALAIGGVLSAGAQAALSDVIISEFIEGSGSKTRAVELTNTGTDTVLFEATDFITIEKNDGTPRTPVSLDGYSINPGETLVIVDSTTDPVLLDAIAQNQPDAGNVLTHADANFYGYNNVSLAHNGTVLDSVGITGSDNDFSVDKTIRRRAIDENGTAPAQTDVYKPAEWEVLPTNTIDGAGSPTLSEVSIPAELKTINEIQDGYFDGLKVEVSGTVSAVLTSAVQGFYIYQENNDGNPATSDGLFVKSNAFNIDPNDSDSRLIAAGDVVTLVGTVIESYGQTELQQIESTVVDSTGGTVPIAVDLKMIEADDGSFKNMMRRYDGMFVNLPIDIDLDGKAGDQTMRVTQPYTKDWENYSNNMHLAYDSIKIQPNQENVAGSQDAIDAIEKNKDKTLIIEADNKDNTIDIIDYYPDFNPATSSEYKAIDHVIRINDGVVGLRGAVQLEYGTYTLYVPQGSDYDATKDTFIKNTPRTTTPDLDLSSMASDEFAITVATQNVLNLFNSPFGGDTNLHGDNRGADTEEEFTRQQDKIVNTIRAIDADILGLMEIENNGFGSFSAISKLVAQVNEYYSDRDPSDKDKSYSTTNKYVFVGFDSDGNSVLDSLDSVGTDAITSGILYRPSTVTLKETHIISMPRQDAPTIVNDNNQVVKDSKNNVLENGKNYMRETVAAEFTVNQTGKNLTVAVNHFKSKGSTCWEDWKDTDFGETVIWKNDPADDDQQGNCENFRVAGAVQLGTELEKLGGDQVVIGDFNSYAKEDPMLVLTKNTTNKTLTAARNTLIGNMPQYGDNGATITKSFGLINVVQMKDALKGHPSWSYIWNDEVGSLDHLLITPSLENRLVDAVDWHINSSEAPLLDYNFEYKGDGIDGNEDTEDDNGGTLFYKDDVYRSSDHDSAVLVLSYKYGESEANQPVLLPFTFGTLNIPYTIPAGIAAEGDVVKVSLRAVGNGADLSDATIPNGMKVSAGDTFVDIEIEGMSTGTYDVTMYLERPSTQLSSNISSTVVAGSEINMNIKVAKEDSTTTPKIPTPETDGTGGSFGIFSVLSLLGLGFLRRKAK